jgi:hypothetical protein
MHSLHYSAMRRSSDWAAFQNCLRNASFCSATKRTWLDMTEVPYPSSALYAGTVCEASLVRPVAIGYTQAY